MINEKMMEKKVIRDNIHGNISIEYKVIWDLINADAFQRLRRIHQLGGTYMVFPSAEHSRFTHSLGVYNIVKRIINEVEGIKEHLENERNIIVLLCAGLLHDIGHGPYSHAFEDVFNSNHEEKTIEIITKDTTINKILSSYDPTIAKEIASIISKTHPNKIMIQVISSQVDADRMDYLLRDAYNCGVSYGNFDLERLLRSMVVYDNKLVFKESGIHAIEDYIFARYHMYWQVYLHPTANSFEIILTKILRRVKDLFENNYNFKQDINLLIPFLKGEKVLVNDYLQLDESIIIYYFSQFRYEDDEILSDLCHCFLERKLFKHRDIKDYKQGQDMINNLETDKTKQEYYFDMQTAKSAIYKYYGDLNSQSIMILTKEKDIKELYDASDLVNAIVDSAQQKQEKKIYFHQKYLSKLNE
ncbi:HD superfamily phosphohydrolase [Bacilli bacterium PM5-3]|nr:HD superfamily phosphohydrolase [Bacilli bacterium PM5-3]MDH6603916.1 HD superfamily phosphohydrolase [Bacilli bacterium PM5-9]